MVLFAAKIILTPNFFSRIVLKMSSMSADSTKIFLKIKQYHYTIFINIGDSDIHQQQFMKKFNNQSLNLVTFWDDFPDLITFPSLWKDISLHCTN